MKIDVDAAKRHLELLAGTSDPVVAWQVFDDAKTNKGRTWDGSNLRRRERHA